MSIAADNQSLSPGKVVDLFEVDLNPIGIAETYYFHAGVNGLNTAVIWDGVTYEPWGIRVEGFAVTGQGALPRPKLGLSNVTGLIGALARQAQDLVGAKLTRTRTYAKYLDAVNFPDGVNPTADPTAYIRRDIWFFDRKAVENKLFMEYELAAAYDVAGVTIPSRPVIQVCAWLGKGGYRGVNCTYDGPPVADMNDDPVTTLELDKCAGRPDSCKLRFGANARLPFGGFPGVGILRR